MLGEQRGTNVAAEPLEELVRSLALLVSWAVRVQFGQELGWRHALVNQIAGIPRDHALNAPTGAEAEAGIDAFAGEYDAKYPKAVASLLLVIWVTVSKTSVFETVSRGD